MEPNMVYENYWNGDKHGWILSIKVSNLCVYNIMFPTIPKYFQNKTKKTTWINLHVKILP
jgi:hypothetical protein